MRLTIIDRQMNTIVDVMQATSEPMILWCLEFAATQYRNAGYIWKISYTGD